MILNQRPLGLDDGLFDRVKLLRDLQTRPVCLHHLHDAAQMALGPLQPLDDLWMAGMNMIDHFVLLSPWSG